MPFKHFKIEFQNHFAVIAADEERKLFTTDVDPDVLWEMYLDSFPTGANPIYKTRREYDCAGCRKFMRHFGSVVMIKDNRLVTIWDFVPSGEEFRPVVQALDTLVKQAQVTGVFVTKHAGIGIDKNYSQTAEGDVITWEHFHVKLPARLVNSSSKSISDLRAAAMVNKETLHQALEELSLQSTETVLDLIAEQQLYRGTEQSHILVKFLELQYLYRDIPVNQRDLFCWRASTTTSTAVAKIRNLAIGSLLKDITQGMDVPQAIRRFESTMSAETYKRPSTEYSLEQVNRAEQIIAELGLLSSLSRRYAHIDDITINNVLWANKATFEPGIFAQLRQATKTNPEKFNQLPGIRIEAFIKDILPNVSDFQILLENRHEPNLVSLIAPKVPDSPSLFKWSNSMTHAYNGNVADSMKQRVKRAGGKVDGVLRFSLQWNEQGNNRNDFDAHCVEPSGYHIFYRQKANITTDGRLDVDIIHPHPNQAAVENITWNDKNRMGEGVYRFYVRNYSHRGGRDGFTAELEFDGTIYRFRYQQNIAEKEDVPVVELHFSRAEGIKILESLPINYLDTKEMWNIKTNCFHPVTACMYSPNFWDGQQGIGNQHFFFMLSECLNPDQPSGFYNEFLKEELMKQKHVFAALGDKMKVDASDNQLSGLGFSSTIRNYLICKVDGRAVKVVF